MKMKNILIVNADIRVFCNETNTNIFYSLLLTLNHFSVFRFDSSFFSRSRSRSLVLFVRFCLIMLMSVEYV